MASLCQIVRCLLLRRWKTVKRRREPYPNCYNKSRGTNKKTVTIPVAKSTASNQGDDLDCSIGRLIQQALFRRIAKGDNELAEEVGDPAVGHVS